MKALRTYQRYLRPLRYLPVVLFSLFALGWIVSLSSEAGFFHRVPTRNATYRGYLSVQNGSLGYSIYPYVQAVSQNEGFVRETIPGPFHLKNALGDFRWQRRPWVITSVPFCWLITALLPLTIGVFNRYRFRPWMIAAWLAMIAGQGLYFAGMLPT